MPLPLSVAKATKNMPAGKGTYGSKRGRPAKKSTAAKKPVAKKPTGAKKMPPAMLKRIEEMKKKKAAGKAKK